MARRWAELAVYTALGFSSVAADPSFNRTEGIVELGTCQGLKTKIELGLDMTIVLISDILCSETITLTTNQFVSISSSGNEEYVVAIAEDFSVPDPTSSTLFVVSAGASLSLEKLYFTNEAGVQGSPGAVRAVWNTGSLDVYSCTFEGLNFAAIQDGGAIYNTGDAGFVSIGNSTFVGNLAKDRGGAIVADGQGSVDLSNCTFYSNEAFGSGPERRAGSGGAVYASPGMIVSVMNSSFESCLGRYGGAALFLCGGSVIDSTFDSNEADGLFGAVVNGDLSDEGRLNASLALGTSDGENYTCPGLSISGSVFENNAAGNGYGGAVASIDSDLSVYNSSMVQTTGGALYFGTSDTTGRHLLEMDLVIFNENSASDSILTTPKASAFFVEHIGLEIDTNATDLTTTSEGSSSSAIQAASSTSQMVVGAGSDLYCFQNSPYECEGYFGQAKVTLSGTLRCNTCVGDAFTGIGTPGSAPTPAPVVSDDDDGLSKMGQERAQGGTPAPTPLGYRGSSGSSSSSGSGNGANGGGDDEPELFGQTGDMRWVVVGLLAGLGTAFLCCLCLLVICKGGKKDRTKRKSKRPKRENEEEMRAARVGPLSASAVRPASSSSQGVASQSPTESKNQFFAVSPGGSTSVKRSSVVTTSSVHQTPLAARKAKELARQRAIQRSVEADSAAEAGYWNEVGGGWAESGPGLAMAGSPSFSTTSKRKSGGFAALPGTEGESERRKSNSRLPLPVPGSLARSTGSRSRSPCSRSRSSSRCGSRNGQDIGGNEWRLHAGDSSATPENNGDRRRAVKTPAGGARLPIAAGRDSSSDSLKRPSGAVDRGQTSRSSSRSRSPQWRAESLISPMDDLLSAQNSTHGSSRTTGLGSGSVRSSSQRPSGEIAMRGAAVAAADAVNRGISSRESSSRSMRGRGGSRGRSRHDDYSARPANDEWEWGGSNAVPSTSGAIQSLQLSNRSLQSARQPGTASESRDASRQASMRSSRNGSSRKGSRSPELGRNAVIDALQHDYGDDRSRGSGRSSGRAFAAGDESWARETEPFGTVASRHEPAKIVTVKRGQRGCSRSPDPAIQRHNDVVNFSSGNSGKSSSRGSVGGDPSPGRAMMFSSKGGSRDVVVSRERSRTKSQESSRAPAWDTQDPAVKKSQSYRTQGRPTGEPHYNPTSRFSRNIATNQEVESAGGWAADLYQQGRVGGSARFSGDGGGGRAEDQSGWSNDVEIGVSDSGRRG